MTNGLHQEGHMKQYSKHFIRNLALEENISLYIVRLFPNDEPQSSIKHWLQ